MAAYDSLLDLIKEYFSELGYNFSYLDDFFSKRIFKELISIRLANANVITKNKTDKKSHQTHIAITGEAMEFFYNEVELKKRNNSIIEKRNVYISTANVTHLFGEEVYIADPMDMELVEGVVTVGTRTQNQIQLSKKNSENSANFNKLRLGLFENDLLIMMKFREKESFLVIGIPQVFYLDYIPNYAKKYETNTYLRIPRFCN